MSHVVLTELIRARLSMKRRLHHKEVAPISQAILECIVQGASLEILQNQVQEILNDCEIYHGMTRNEALDTVSELSKMATLFIGFPTIYVKVCNLLTQLQRSYPAPTGSI